MSAQLDIDDACSPHPVAKSELDQLRAENTELIRLIRDVAIPALNIAEAGGCAIVVRGGVPSNPISDALAQLQEAVK